MTDTPPPFTLRAAAGLPPAYGPLNDAVLIVIDAQMEYAEDGALALPGLQPALDNITALLLAGRKDGAEIVHIAHEGSPGRAFDPENGGRIIEQVAPFEGETVIGKGLPNSFAHTGLQNHLAEIGRPHLVICGFMTHMCVSSTARAALDLGYETTVVSDATATRDLPSTSGGQPIAAGRPSRGIVGSVGGSFQRDQHDSTGASDQRGPLSMSEELYGAEHIEFLEALWGDGYLSPGGPEEVARILDGVELTDQAVLDIGCGTGGIAVSLAEVYGAGPVVGIDVEASVCAAARARVERAGMAGRVAVRQVEPGPLPFLDETFDVVFSKDSIVHIPDKFALATTVFSVLKPGGWFVASDWLTNHDGEPSPEMKRYLELEDLGFGMASPDAYEAALEGAGFINISFENRNGWYKEQARHELDRLTGPERATFVAALGEEEIASQIETWQAMITVLDSGEHCPHHFRAKKQ